MNLYDFLLPDESITSAVSDACSFFNLNDTLIINADGVCEWSYDTRTSLDDVLGVNKEQLSDLGLLNHDSITLAYTHECAHRALQGLNEFSPKEEELACDFFAGIHAEMMNLDSTSFESALHSFSESETHPDGETRHEGFLHGKEFVSYLHTQGITPTFDLCLDEFKEYIRENPIDDNHQNSEISFGSAYSSQQYIEKAENCYREADKYYDKAMRDEKASDKAHDLEQAEKWRRRGDEYMSESKYADK